RAGARSLYGEEGRADRQTGQAGQARVRRRRSRPARPLPQEIARPVMAEDRKPPAKNGAKTRTESDAFGPLDIPADRLWGAQTEPSLHNFRIGTERMPIGIIHALGLIKRAAAEVNRDLGSLDAKRANAIVAVAQDIVDGKLDDNFPL